MLARCQWRRCGSYYWLGVIIEVVESSTTHPLYHPYPYLLYLYLDQWPTMVHQGPQSKLSSDPTEFSAWLLISSRALIIQ